MWLHKGLSYWRHHQHQTLMLIVLLFLRPIPWLILSQLCHIYRWGYPHLCWFDDHVDVSRRIIQGWLGMTDRLECFTVWRLYLRITSTIFSSICRLVGYIGSWVTFPTALPSRLRYIGRASAIYSSSCIPAEGLGSWVLFYSSSPAKLGAMTLTNTLVVLSMPLNKKDLSSRLLLWFISKYNLRQDSESPNSSVEKWGTQRSTFVLWVCFIELE